MKFFLLFLTVLSISTKFVSTFNHQSPPNLRRIGGKQQVAQEYPSYVVELALFSNITKTFIHHCMGTLLSFNWTITAGHCFQGNDTDQLIFHGSTSWQNASKYEILARVKHDTDDLGLVNHYHINFPSQYFPAISKVFCPEEVRGVYHSWGTIDDENFHHTLLYSTVETHIRFCEHRPHQTICFTAIDGTYPMKGDAGAGVISGYGPGPIFPDTHDVTIMGVIHSSLEREKTNVSVARRLSEYITWIQFYVDDLKVVGSSSGIGK